MATSEDQSRPSRALPAEAAAPAAIDDGTRSLPQPRRRGIRSEFAAIFACRTRRPALFPSDGSPLAHTAARGTGAGGGAETTDSGGAITRFARAFFP